MSEYEFQRPPMQPTPLFELQKMHAVSNANQKAVIERLDQLVAGQQEQTKLLQELVQAMGRQT